MLAAYEALADMDIIHDHTFLGPLISGLRANACRPPGRAAPTTAPSPGRRSPALSEIARHASPRGHLAALRPIRPKSNGGAEIAAVIHHGIDLDLYKAGRGGGGLVMFIGRMSPDKGVHHAIRIAKKA